MRGINKKIISLFLAFTIVLTTFGLSSNTSYAASIKLNKTNITLLRKQTSQLKVKNTNLNKNTQDGYTEIGYKTVHKGVVYYFYHGGISSPNFSRGWQGFINAETLERYLSLP